MTDHQLGELVLAARQRLPDDSEWSMMYSVPAGARTAVPADLPTGYATLLSIVDGGIFGRVVLFDAKTIEQMQFYADPIPGVPVRLDPGRWCCIGKVNEDPLFVDRTDGTVWWFPDVGVIWWQSDRFERLADDVTAFMTDHVFGAGYRALTGADEDDQWWRLLRALGRA
jgi:hypothetical protein